MNSERTPRKRKKAKALRLSYNLNNIIISQRSELMELDKFKTMMNVREMSECVEMAGTSSTSYHRYKQIAVLNFARIHQNRELEAYK